MLHHARCTLAQAFVLSFCQLNTSDLLITIGLGAAGPGSVLSHIGSLPAPTMAPHPGAHAGRVSLPAGLPAGGAARLPARVTKSASSPGRFHGRSGSAPGGMSHSPDVGPGFHPAAVHRSQSTRIGAMNPNNRLAYACECLCRCMASHVAHWIPWPTSRDTP
jgi:hypothetical protein